VGEGRTRGWHERVKNSWKDGVLWREMGNERGGRNINLRCILGNSSLRENLRPQYGARRVEGLVGKNRGQRGLLQLPRMRRNKE